MEPFCENRNDRKALWEALLDNRIDVIATDHALIL
jgi:dihydroorotase